jgi:insulysin
VTFAKLREFTEKFLSRLHTDFFIYGNVNKAKASAIVEMIKEELKATKSCSEPFKSQEIIPRRQHHLNEGEKFLFEAQTIHNDNCTLFYLQCGVQSDENCAVVDLIAQIMSEPFFSVLR